MSSTPTLSNDLWLHIFSHLPLSEVRRLPSVCSAWARMIQSRSLSPDRIGDRRVKPFGPRSFGAALRLVSLIDIVDRGKKCSELLNGERWGRISVWLEAETSAETVTTLKGLLEQGAALEQIRTEEDLTGWLAKASPHSAFFYPPLSAGTRWIPSLPRLFEYGSRGEAQFITTAAYYDEWKAIEQLIVDRGPGFLNALDAYGRPAICHRWVIEKADGSALRGLLTRGAGIDCAADGQPACLQEAARLEALHAVQLLLGWEATPADPNRHGYAGRTALHEATWRGNNAIAEALIDAGAKLEARCNSGWTPLIYAHAHPDAIQFLLDRGASIGATAERGTTCLIEACTTESIESIRLLLERAKGLDLDLDHKDRQGRSALSLAVEKDNLPIMRLLLEAGASANVTNRLNWPVHASAKSIGALTLLLDHQADPNLCEGEALSQAASGGDLEAVELLLQRGAVIPKVSLKPMHPLFQAAMECHLPVIQRLVTAGADLGVRDEEGWTVMHHAAIAGDREEALAVCDYLREQGLDINARSYKGRSPLNVLAENAQAVKLMGSWVKRGADLNQQDDEGCMVIHWSIFPTESDQLSVLRALLKCGPDLGIKDSRGRTPLELALWSLEKILRRADTMIDKRGALVAAEGVKWEESMQNHLHRYSPWLLAKSLLEAGTTLGRFDRPKYELECVKARLERRAFRLEVVKLLHAHGAKLNEADSKGRYPMHCAAREGDLQLAEFLVGKKSPADLPDGQGRTPLHWAVLGGNPEMVQLLLQQGAAVDRADGMGNTPAKLASIVGNKAVIRLLK